MPEVALHLRHLELLGRAPETIAARRRALGRMRIALGKSLLEASAADLKAWRAALAVAPGTVAGYVSHAIQFYAWAVAEGVAEANPAAGLPVPRQGRMLPRPAGEADLFAAVAGAPPRIRPWLVLAGWAGLRAKEIALLQRKHVHETARPPVLLIARDATKGTRERVVPLCAFALEALAEHGLPARGWVFRRADGQHGPNTPMRVSGAANRWLHREGFSFTLHQLRHRFATEAYRTTRDLRLVQELLGHASPLTTAGYAAIVQDGAIGAVEALPVPGRLKVVGG